MALPVLSLTLRDSYGRETRKLIEMYNHLLHADQVILAQQIIADLEAVTDLGVVRADIVYKGVDAGNSPTAGSNIDTGATFVGYLEDGNGNKATIKVPGIKPALVASDGSIEITGAVASYLANFEDDGFAYCSDGEQITSWVGGKLDK